MATITGDANSANLNDVLIGGDTNDRITGGLGNDTLTGGGGNDKFVFTFSLVTEIKQPEQVTLSFPGLLEGANANGQWNDGSFLAALDAWRAEQIALYGDDLNTDTQAYSYTFGNSTKKPELHTRDVEYDGTFTYWKEAEATTVVTGEGDDVILDFTRVDGRGEKDQLQLKGFDDLEQAEAYLNFTVADGNTVISWGGGSITMMGLTQYESLAAMYEADAVSFG